MHTNNNTTTVSNGGADADALNECPSTVCPSVRLAHSNLTTNPSNGHPHPNLLSPVDRARGNSEKKKLYAVHMCTLFRIEWETRPFIVIARSNARL